MRKLLLPLCGVALLCGVGAARADALDDQVTAAYAAWNTAFNKGDASGIASFYTDDAKLLPPDHNIYEGPAGVEKFFTAVLGNGLHDHALELIDAESSGDYVIAAAKWSAKGKDASGAETTFGGIVTHVFEKQPDGSLKLELMTFN